MKDKLLITMNDFSYSDDEWVEWFDCPNCKISLIQVFWKYCPNCGKELEWDEELKQMVKEGIPII